MSFKKLDQQTLDAVKKIPRPLVKAVLEFNFSPASYTHPDHLSREENGPDHQLASYLLSQPRIQPRLSNAIIKTKGLDSYFHIDLDSPLELLALLDQEDQQRIARSGALLLHNASARRFIDGKSVSRITRLVGRDGLEFALQTPDNNPGNHYKIDIDELLERIEIDSVSLLAAWLNELPSPMAKRVKLRYPVIHFANKRKPANALAALHAAAERFVPLCLNKKI